ncbi:hypothetical protein [Streptomyces sp. NPDC050546]|uniref:hypothetical protein n=1 Tax=Streptomyces sp. NPDC050546 TaxID=3365628 RepID=UPI00379B0A27
MAICIHHITLRPEADENAFARFAAEELLPAARTFTGRRAGLHDDRHVIVKDHTEERTYLWITEWTFQGSESPNSFTVAVGPRLKSKLDAFAVHSFKLYAGLARSSHESIVTPTLDVPDDLTDPEGWLGEDNWNVV